MQNDALAMVCMIMISLLFIPNPICTLWITVAMITIDVGVIGFLSLWGVKLDPISMITLVLSIGFSIEFCAHVTYGFVSNSNNLSPRQRCIDTMEKLAWPMVHGSMSTILGVLVLAFINSYMVLVFFKTIFLVLAIGIFHALVFLPIILHDTAPLTDRLNAYLDARAENRKKRKKSAQNSVKITVLRTTALFLLYAILAVDGSLSPLLCCCANRECGWARVNDCYCNSAGSPQESVLLVVLTASVCVLHFVCR
ncbi:PTR-6 protein [Aphelenchoides avenae]|nr:PTR-6 protein [Aphelenchus avenae]